ncbi:MAG TPA: hypothetical protein VFB38_25055 [Chthonomonadaceae bacterium]|nr:hypothetical protein [Chthonomonadaceae bacterium]
MTEKGGMSPLVPAIVFSLLIGGIGGFCVRYYSEMGSPAAASPVSASGGPGGMMGRGGPGGMGGMMGGRGGQTSPGMALPRLVRNLSTIEKVQNKGLTPQQAQTLLPILKSLQSAGKLPDKEAQAKLDAINKVLTEPQKQALQELQPRFGGGGRGGGMMGGGMMGGGRMGGGMMGGGGQDPERPFASERNKQALDDLIAQLGGSSRQ